MLTHSYVIRLRLTDVVFEALLSSEVLCMVCHFLFFHIAQEHGR